ncbi:hypothetical protein POTOM_002306 [Populus tomentosa]|uniref:SWIB domain-containing protein n=1 Tax=Populus tomentosa TaxID=118781 RepID=A0A8X8DJJ5_POPTO|nr:hypothetical protein POTOM_002306 [Populus tomentosa]
MEISSRTCFPFLSTETVPLLKLPFHTSSPSLRTLAARPVNLRMGRTVVTCATASTGNRAPSGIMKPRRVSPEMADFVGAPEVSRTQVLKLIWAHIKEHNLQGNVPVLLTFYECALLRWVAMNEVWVMRLPYFSSKMLCFVSFVVLDDAIGLIHDVLLSVLYPSLSAVISRVEYYLSEVLSHVELSYSHGLMIIVEYNDDPSNKKNIICDEKLKKIFPGRDQVGFLEIAGLISPHFLK